MGLFKELKEDFSQAINELMPMEDYLEDFLEEENSQELEEEDEKDKNEQAEAEIQNQRDLQLMLEKEVKAAIDALDINAINSEEMEE